MNTPRRTWAGIALTLASTLAACNNNSPPAPGPDAAVNAGGGTDAAGDAGLMVPYVGPDDWCPGQPHCAAQGDNQLYVGAARQTINPTLVEWEWTDLNHNNLYDRGEPFVDRNHNGIFDGTWIAGFDNSRPATGQHDDTEVRALALRYNGTTVVIAVIDAIGYFIDEMDRIRRDPRVAGLDVDHIIFGATHCHECTDTVGLWGPDPATTGLNTTFQQYTRDQMALAIQQAVQALHPARMRVAQVQAVDAAGSTMDYVNDTRDPIIFDPTLTVMQFTDAAAPTHTIATWVNFAAHPEFTGSHNNLVTADYPHTLRATIEQGLAAEGLAGVGGITLFQNGPLGGQVGPGGGVHPHDPGAPGITDSGFDKAAAEGRSLARLALDALAHHGEDVAAPAISYRTAALFAQVDNIGYAAFYLTHVFDRELLHFDPTRPAGGANTPWVRSRETYLQVGPVATITAPGELHPELWVGVDMRWSWGRPILNPTVTVNVPDLAQAPRPPYLHELMLQNPGVRYTFVSGLSEDFLGYIVAQFNYVLDPVAPYLRDAPGQHYEETNSIGPLVEEHLQHPMMALARWRPPAGP